MGTDEDGAAMAARSRLRRERLVAHRASGHADAEALDFWQSQSPEEDARVLRLVLERRCPGWSDLHRQPRGDQAAPLPSVS